MVFPGFTSVKGFQAVVHPYQVPPAAGLQMRPAVQAVEGHYGLRLREVSHVADTHEARLRHPPVVYIFHVPQDGYDDPEEVWILPRLPDKKLHMVL